MPQYIEVSKYQHDWPARFKAESDLVRGVFGLTVESIHHIGSTSVPNMHAKPVIDILVVVKPDTQVENFYPGMEKLGYDCRGECLNAPIPGTIGRYYFSKDVDGKRHSHVHVCHVGHFQIAELLAMRDYLRTHPEAAQEYGALKSNLAKQFAYDNHEYMKGKDAYIKQLISLAMAWRSNAGNKRK